MSWAIVAGAAISAVGVGLGEKGRAKSAKSAKRERRALLGFQLQQAERSNRVAGQLEGIANKLLSDTPLSGSEKAVLDKAQFVTNTQINRATADAKKSALAEQAATGFLKSGRTARQIRRLNIESSEARQRTALTREQSIQQIVEQRRQQALQALSAAGGFGIPQFQQFAQPLNRQQAIGGGLTQIGGGILGSGADFSQIFGGGGGGTQVATPQTSPTVVNTGISA